MGSPTTSVGPPPARSAPADIRGRPDALREAGAEVVRDVRDVGNGRLTAFVQDADGNQVGLLQDPPA
ncbi:VOC family protein [Streptomyces sp. NPDC020490]|uniref:VOC family protein n=1 Tax=Streptomyces sp. NPDC020490 TaxID=3365078 RepID=UPI0037AA54B4